MQVTFVVGVEGKKTPKGWQTHKKIQKREAFEETDPY